MIMPQPAPPFAQETLRRLPLAEAFYLIWAHLADQRLLDDLFGQHRGRCYEDAITFTQLVHVLADALTRFKGKGRGAIRQAVEQQRLDSQARAFYLKLGRLPLPLAEAFLARLTQALTELLPAGYHLNRMPVSLAPFAVVVIDGKKIKKAAKRLLPTRSAPGKLYGGKILVAYLPATGLAVAMAADPDGEANDIRLVPRLIPQVQAAVAGPRLWVADRQFGDLTQPPRLTAGGDHYVIRYSKRVCFEADPQRPAQTGVDSQGRTVVQEWGWLGKPEQGPRRLYVRRITLLRGSQEAVILVSDLLDEVAYPAEDLLEVYLSRWQIEGVFQQITEVFELRSLIGSRPEATVFQASLCLVIYNVLQAVRGYVAEGQQKAVAKVSSEMLFEDMKKDLIALHEVLKPEELLPLLDREPLGPVALCARLRELLCGLWSSSWAKVVNKKPRPRLSKVKKSGAHTSVHKILQKERERARKDKTPAPTTQ